MHDISFYLSQIERLDGQAFMASHPCPVLVYRGGLQVDERVRHFNPPIDNIITAKFAQTLPEGTVVPINTVYELCKRDAGDTDERIRIGRASTNDVQIVLARVSKFHAFIRWTSVALGYVITDVGAVNGTHVDRDNAVPHVPLPLHDGASVALGPYQFLFMMSRSFYTFVRSLNNRF